jgi:hypothetical protein
MCATMCVRGGPRAGQTPPDAPRLSSREQWGNTPLCMCAMGDKVGPVPLLLQHRADPSIRDRVSGTARAGVRGSSVQFAATERHECTRVRQGLRPRRDFQHAGPGGPGESVCDPPSLSDPPAVPQEAAAAVSAAHAAALERATRRPLEASMDTSGAPQAPLAPGALRDLLRQASAAAEQQEGDILRLRRQCEDLAGQLSVERASAAGAPRPCTQRDPSCS